MGRRPAQYPTSSASGISNPRSSTTRHRSHRPPIGPGGPGPRVGLLRQLAQGPTITPVSAGGNPGTSLPPPPSGRSQQLPLSPRLWRSPSRPSSLWRSGVRVPRGSSGSEGMRGPWSTTPVQSLTCGGIALEAFSRGVLTLIDEIWSVGAVSERSHRSCGEAKDSADPPWRNREVTATNAAPNGVNADSEYPGDFVRVEHPPLRQGREIDAFSRKHDRTMPGTFSRSDGAGGPP